jgi:SanA protein
VWSYKKIAKTALIPAAVLTAAAVFFVVYANLRIMSYRQYTKNEISALPVEKACLVLGTSKFLVGGGENQFYAHRMKATAEAYAAGKCAKVVVSGDNRHRSYNEPQTMKKSLIEQGIPAEDIHCDYAGSRTLDSVVRFKYIFGQSSGIVISQEFHNARAIYIGRANGIDLTGFNAKEVTAYNAFRTRLREVFSRVLAVLDVELLHSEPRHYGEEIPL